MTYPNAKQLRMRCEDAMEQDRLALQATILRRQRRDEWSAPVAFFWLFFGAVVIAIIALFVNR
jgi:hypothetical protein